MCVLILPEVEGEYCRYRVAMCVWGGGGGGGGGGRGHCMVNMGPESDVTYILVHIT